MSVGESNNMNRLLFSAALAVCLASSASAQDGGSDDKVVHLLNRITFGPSPGDIDRVKSIGIKGFIEEQLNPAKIPESPEILDMVAAIPTAKQSNEELIRQLRERRKADQDAQKAAGSDGVKDAVQKTSGYLGALRQQYVATKLARYIESPRQLQEVMTEFWFNHFNVCMAKGMDTILIDSYENQAIRPNALGKFRDLVEATCHHPAMLFYLDNWQNTAPNSPGARGQHTGLNENYARELMELHTLGVDGGYTQKDVIELARILTGLGIAAPEQIQRSNLQPIGNLGAYFASNRHDFGEKVLLGHSIRGSGAGEIQEALDLLIRHPSTAHHISYQLAQYFVCDNPPASLVNKLSERFTASDGDIKAVLRELFSSKEFWDPQYENAKFKSPVRYVVSTMRASGTRPEDYRPTQQFLKLQGEQVFGCLTPDGYKNTKEAWLNPDGLLRRINFATAAAAGKLPGANSQPVDYQKLSETINGGKFSEHTTSVISKAPPPLKAAVLLGSPEFMRY
jgi:uncharacterized protein (DUF1800 family)